MTILPLSIRREYASVLSPVFRKKDSFCLGQVHRLGLQGVSGDFGQSFVEETYGALNLGVLLQMDHCAFPEGEMSFFSLDMRWPRNDAYGIILRFFRPCMRQRAPRPAIESIYS